MVKKGEWVLIHDVVLKPEDRAPQVPDDTKAVPLEMWCKGYLTHDAEIGDHVKVKTQTGRVIEGELVQVSPSYNHSFGEHIEELHQIGFQLREILFGGDDHE